MNNLPTQEEFASLIKENNMLRRRVERMTKEMKNLVALHDRAMKLRDYSEREKKLQFEYNILLLENAPDMIFILDLDMRFRLGTKAFVRFLGQEDAGKLVDASFSEFFSGIMPDSWIASTRVLFEASLNDCKQWQYNDEVNLHGERKVFTISVAPAIDSDGKIMGVICLMHDSTELVSMKEAAEAATQAKSSFLASMSHEIRTPMNAIKGFSDLMIRTPLSAQQKTYVDNIITATSSLLMIINDILDFSKIEANRYEIVNVEYDTALELSVLFGLMQPKADEKGIYFITDIDPGLPSALIGDNLRIRQILTNIINNAIKFTHQGGIVFSLSGEPISESDWLLTFRVKDTGQGIRPEELPKIFQAFEQADFYKNRNISGTGLGLTISKNLAALMGGDITVSSKYGVGSEFTVRLPQTVASQNVLATVESPQERSVILYHPTREIAAHIERSLQKLGVSYKTAFAMGEFFSAVHSGSPTHIILDGNLHLEDKVAEVYPHIRIGCLQSLNGPCSDLFDNVRFLGEPLSIIDLAAFLNGQESRGASAHVKSDVLGRMNLSGVRVLIVDDFEINLIVASEIMKTYGIEPDIAYSGPDAIEKIKGASYDIVFMDHMMPGMDGLETTAMIRAMNIPQPVIIALTANAMQGMEEIYKNGGFDGYITKPIDADSLNAIFEKRFGNTPA